MIRNETILEKLEQFGKVQLSKEQLRFFDRMLCFALKNRIMSYSFILINFFFQNVNLVLCNM